MGVDELDRYLLIGSAVLVVAVVAVRFSVRTGLPSLLAYLALGVILGEAGLGIRFGDADLALALGFSALVLILAEGGLTASRADVEPALWPGLALATAGSAVSVTVVACGSHFLFGMPWHVAILIGAVLTPTDAAAVFSVLRTVRLKRSVTGVLEIESGLNDAPIVVLVLALSAGQVHADRWWQFGLTIVAELVIGVAIGFAIGFLASFILARMALPASGLYPVVVVATCVLAYASAASAHTSGFAAVYVAALVMGNSPLPHRRATRSFVEGVAWIAQIGLFVMLGLLASPESFEWRHLVEGVVVGAILTFVARPLCILASAAWFGKPPRELAFLAWAGLRGAVPIVLATIPLAAGVEGAHDIFNVVFVTCVFYTAIQAVGMPQIAAWCKVLSGAARDVEVEAAPLERIAADLLQLRIGSGSKLAGVEIAELRLPEGALVTLVVRDDASFVPTRTTRLRRRDEILVVTTRDVRDETERRLLAISQGGRLAGW